MPKQKEKRVNKTKEELVVEQKQTARQKFLEDIEKVNIKHKMRLVPQLAQTKPYALEAVFNIEDIVEAEFKKADKQLESKDDKESKANKSTDSDDKGTKE